MIYRKILLCASALFLTAFGMRAYAQEPKASKDEANKSAEPTQKPKGKSVLDELSAEDLLGKKPLNQAEFNKLADEVVAIVGGKELKKKNVWEAFAVPRDTDQIPPFNREILEKSIENELVYQEGLRRGIDKTEEYKSRLQEEKIHKWKNQVPRLAMKIQEKKLGEFKQTIPQSTPSPPQVEELLVQYRTFFPKETASDESISSTLRNLLVVQGPYNAYQKWLADLFDTAKVSVNGKSLLPAKVSQSLRNFSLVDGIRGIKAGQKEAQMMYDAIRRELPGDTDVISLKIAINDDTFTVGEEPELQGILQMAKSAHKEKLSAATKQETKDFALKLFSIIKNYILAQEAKKEGITLANEGPLWETPAEKSIINSIAIEKIVAEEKEVEPTKKEIIDFYREHPMYQGMDIDSAKTTIYKRLCSEKTRQVAVDRLKERFKVEIVKTE
ncbi:MAG: hypothetical protein NTZ78_03810 [Candidatus Aureabacteria bacterium]|nr:hypothetical protein [Candidatus Auribacterota bacterium]